MKRVLIYAAIYGTIGVSVGIMLALYTQDVEPKVKTITLNGSNNKGTTGAAVPDATPVEPSHVEEN